MKKWYLAFILGLFGILSSNAQLSLGPTAGINYSKVNVDQRFNYNDNVLTIRTDEPFVGFQIGAFARLSLSALFIQPELYFSQSGGSVELTSDVSTRDVWDLKYNKLNLPVLIGGKFLNFLRIEAGPVFSWILTDDARKVDNVIDNVEMDSKTSMVGYQAGLGIDLGEKIYIDLRYEDDLSKYNDVVIDGRKFETDFSSSQFILSLGFNIL